MVETRKLAAILAADVVGYSRLAGSDEDPTTGAAPGRRRAVVFGTTHRFGILCACVRARK
jgi:class 3 adenylate cyclase